MPLYEYQCQECGKVFEVIQRFSDAPITSHEECGGAVEKLMSAPAFQFKGTGWYVTDYGKGGSKKDTDGKDTGGKKDDSPATATKTETKASESSTPAPAPTPAPAAKTD